MTPAVLHRAPGLHITLCLKECHPLQQYHCTKTLLQCPVDFRGFLLTPSPTWWGIIFLMHILHVHIPQGTSFAKVRPASIFETVLKFLFSLLKVSSPSWNSMSHLKQMLSSETAAVVSVDSPHSSLAVSITLPVQAWLVVGKKRADTKERLAKNHRIIEC